MNFWVEIKLFGVPKNQMVNNTKNKPEGRPLARRPNGFTLCSWPPWESKAPNTQQVTTAEGGCYLQQFNPVV